MRVLGVIPARLGSTRLPNKPLQLLAGEPLITRVIQRVLSHGVVHELVVATDSQLVAKVAEREGVQAILTHDGHLSGTDRVAEVAARHEYAAFDAVVNVQGDEPFISREAVAGAVERVAHGDDIGTAAAPLDVGLADDPARVKVVTDADGRALYFSRAVIPHRREAGDPSDGLYWQHLGIYVYTRAALARWVEAPPSAAELAERLEQLRALHVGLTIGVARLAGPAQPGIDTADDLRRAEAHWHALEG
jgi:3-deoxy-manno-octulosonate cytidylyltransferase (CMP-KDO synthetase)